MRLDAPEGRRVRSRVSGEEVLEAAVLLNDDDDVRDVFAHRIQLQGSSLRSALCEFPKVPLAAPPLEEHPVATRPSSVEFRSGFRTIVSSESSSMTDARYPLFQSGGRKSYGSALGTLRRLPARLMNERFDQD